MSVLVDSTGHIYDHIEEYHDGKGYAVNDTVNTGTWVPLVDLFTMPRCPIRFGRRRAFLFGERVKQCHQPVFGGKVCMGHGGSMDWRQFYSASGGYAWWDGPVDFAAHIIREHRNVLETITAEKTCVHLFARVPFEVERNPYHPTLLMETGEGKDLVAAWRRALGLFAAQQ